MDRSVFRDLAVNGGSRGAGKEHVASAMKSDQSAVRGGVTNSRPGSGQPGLGSGLGSGGGQRLPVAPRERKPALAALAVLLILGGALTSAYLVMASGQRVSAIMITQPVAAGQQIPAGAMRQVQIGDTGIPYINWSHRAEVARNYALVPLSPDTLLTNSMVSRNSAAHRGRLVVGLALKPGQLPATRDLAVNRHVSLYAVGGGNNNSGPRPGTVLSTDAIIVNINQPGGGSRIRDDQTTLDVAVPPGEVAQLTQAASAGAVAVALIPDGTRVVPGSGTPPATNEKPARPGNGGQSPGTTPADGTPSPGPGGN